VELTLVGDGPLHNAATRTARMHDVETRVRFVRAMANRELCQTLPDYDVLVTQSDFRETPKSVMEAALSGMPVIVNRHPAVDSKEYAELPVIIVDGGADSYAAALRDLARDTGLRKRLSQETEEAAWRIWDPKASGRATAELMTSLTSPSADTISSPSSG
jgi:glycosyltransferase involved in cell wall biosynthesis